MVHVTLPPVGTDRAWRDAARACLAARIAPADVTWSRGEADAGLFEGGDAPPPAEPGPIRVPPAFVALASQVCWHADPERFARLYAFLTRLVATPGLMADAADPDHHRLRAMDRAVTRDLHKMKAFVRFREVGEPTAPRRAFAAWFEPQHLIAEPAAPFFARRFADMDWLIATPDLCARWDGEAVTFEPGAERPAIPDDAAEELWLTYFRNIFNPARVKTAHMLSEMPKRYWKNLPEAAAIPGMLQTAEARVREMAEAAPTSAPVFAHRIAARAAARPGNDHEPPMSSLAPPDPTGLLGALREEVDACTRCDLYRHATQGVPGEGPQDAPLMMVGEQPGDQEDLAGRPFVGPAGQLFDQLMQEAGIERSSVYLTNAVKHFKFTLRGVRRIHQSPNTTEIRACRWWLSQELSLVRPRLVVAMGASAAESLTGSREGIMKRRGTIEQGPDGVPVFLTVHPSFLLRVPDPVVKEQETERFRQDLVAAKGHLERLLAA